MSKKQPAEKHPRRVGLGGMARLRNYFLTGLVVAGPIGITLYLKTGAGNAAGVYDPDTTTLLRPGLDRIAVPSNFAARFAGPMR